jgi:type I restriction enzyme S subunit
VDERTGGIEATLGQVEREIFLIHEYRTRLVADVVTGQLDVREAAARLPADEPEAAGEELASEADQEEDSEPEEMAE